MKTENCRNLSRTEEIIIGMLRENTGCDMLDSGSLYGRHWQKNQARNFLNEPSSDVASSLYDKSNVNIEYTRLAKVPPALKKIHYDRLNLALQQLFNLPKNPKEARSPEFVKAGWVKATENQNRYHKNKGQINNVKYYNTKTGQEVVFEHDGDNAKIVLDKSNIGTFNYSSSLDFWHLVFDMIPYYIWANSPDDTTKPSERIIGN